jgi:hypothetical protein
VPATPVLLCLPPMCPCARHPCALVPCSSADLRCPQENS